MTRNQAGVEDPLEVVACQLMLGGVPSHPGEDLLTFQIVETSITIKRL